MGNVLAEVYFRDCLHIIPALEFQHIQSAVYVRDLRFHVGFPLLKCGLTLGIGGRARSAPSHELADVLDLHNRILNHGRRDSLLSRRSAFRRVCLACA